MEQSQYKLVLKVTATFAGMVGYGNVYKCEIVAVLTGKTNQKNFSLIVLAGDKVNTSFMDTHLNAEVFEMALKKKNSAELYPLIPISGFVDDNRTSWEIEYLKDIE